VLLVDGKDSPVPVVADFGICHVPGDERRTGTEEQMGPRKYMAPELRDGRLSDAEITSAADVYSLGKLLYFMLAPDVPMFDREDYRDERYRIARVTAREELKHVERIFDVSIQRYPTDRAADAHGLAEEVRRLIPIVSGHYRVIDPEGGQRCLFCGEGRYKVFGPGWLGQPKLQQDVRHLACPECGHTMTFRVDRARKAEQWGPPT
jgi:serine/threonine protein kinase